MALTTNPANVTAGRCAVSFSSQAKRAALLGRRVRHTLTDGAVVIGTVDGFVGGYPRMTIVEAIRAPHGTGAEHLGKWCRLDSVVTLVA